MSWMTGNVSIEEAIGEITKIAVRRVMENQVDGRVVIRLETDGTYELEKPEKK